MQETMPAKFKNSTDKCLLSIGKKKLHLRKLDSQYILNSFGLVYFSIRHLTVRLPTFALTCLITPVSNAEIERIFSPVSSRQETECS
jgi:hypothetical protein